MKQKRLTFTAKTIMIVVAMLFTSIGVSAQENEDTYIVAGSEAEIFGTTWAWDVYENNMMTLGNDGKYRKEYTVEKAYEIVQLKVVRNWNEWIGIGGNENNYRYNFEFNLTGAGTFTVVFDPITYEISVTGDIVETITELSIEQVFAAGNGEDNWLNDAAWDPGYAENEMTEVADDVWQITFNDVPEGFQRQVKFTINGTWAHNFGGTFDDFGVWSAADYNGDNITFDTYQICTVTLTLDLSSFDFDTKLGAQFKIDIDYGETPVTEEVEVTLATTGYGTYLQQWKNGNLAHWRCRLRCK